MLGWIKRSAFSTLAANRDAMPVRGMHKLATFVDSAIRNEGSHFRLNGEWRVLDRLAAFDIRTVVDVGANVGRWSTSAMQAFPNARVHAFEIAPKTAEKAAANFAAGGYAQRATLHTIGLSDAPGTMDMWYFPGADELTCAAPRHHEHESVHFVANVGTLDDFCREHGVDRIDLLKVDVEGNEFRVFRGGSSMLNGKTTCIQFEYGAFSTETRFLLKDYYELLGERYWIGKIFPRYVDFKDFHFSMEDFRFCNYVCVDRSRPDIRDALGRQGGD